MRLSICHPFSYLSWYSGQVTSGKVSIFQIAWISAPIYFKDSPLLLWLFVIQVLDATDDEPWGPHGTVLAEIAQATKKLYRIFLLLCCKTYLSSSLPPSPTRSYYGDLICNIWLIFWNMIQLRVSDGNECSMDKINWNWQKLAFCLQGSAKIFNCEMGFCFLPMLLKHLLSLCFPFLFCLTSYPTNSCKINEKWKKRSWNLC